MAKRCPTCDIVYDDAQTFCAQCGTALRVDGRGDLVGTVIGERYLITGLLGEGGMGRVYRARHVRLPKDVAIKVLDAMIARDPAALRRFADEATRQSRVRNPHVVAVEDFGETADREPYLVMELVEGPTLRELLADGALSPARVVRLITQLADGLQAIHALPIVHRDLKPENVMVTRGADGSEQAKLLDFGIGKALDDSDRGRTQTGLVIGTPAYMSPEQVGAEPLDARSDVYALALMAYEMLVGRLPFAGGSPHELMYSRLTRDPSPVTEARAQAGLEPLSPTVDGVFRAALARDREQRTATATEFARALGGALTTPGAVAAFAARAGRTTESMTPIGSMPAVPATPSRRAGLGTAPSTGIDAATRRRDDTGRDAVASAIGTTADAAIAASAGDAASSSGSPVRAFPTRLIAGVGVAAVAAVIAWLLLRPAAPAAAVAADAAPNTPAVTPAAPSPQPTAVPAGDPAGTAPPRAPAGPPATAPSSALPAPRGPASAAADLEELEAIGALLESEDPEGASPSIVARTAALLPRLRSADDSAEAWLYRGQAFALQRNRIEACRAFDRARPTAARSGTLASINMMRSATECP